MQITEKLYIVCWKHGIQTCGIVLPLAILFRNNNLEFTQ
jgi:hypothetical protein